MSNSLPPSGSERSGLSALLQLQPIKLAISPSPSQAAIHETQTHNATANNNAPLPSSSSSSSIPRRASRHFSKSSLSPVDPSALSIPQGIAIKTPPILAKSGSSKSSIAPAVESNSVYFAPVPAAPSPPPFDSAVSLSIRISSAIADSHTFLTDPQLLSPAEPLDPGPAADASASASASAHLAPASSAISRRLSLQLSKLSKPALNPTASASSPAAPSAALSVGASLAPKGFSGLIKNIVEKRSALRDETAEAAEANKPRSYRHQGDQAFYSRKNLVARAKLRSNPRINQSIDRFWSVFQHLGAKYSIDKRQYQLLHIGLCKCLHAEEFNPAEARALGEKEWKRDIAFVAEEANKSPRAQLHREKDSKADPALSKAAFYRSLFEIVDQWTDSVKLRDYLAMFRDLFDRVTKPDPLNPKERIFRELNEISSAFEHYHIPEGGEEAVIKIQRWWRRVWRRRLHRCARVIQLLWRGQREKMRIWMNRRIAAARIIQYYVRKYVFNYLKTPENEPESDDERHDKRSKGSIDAPEPIGVIVKRRASALLPRESAETRAHQSELDQKIQKLNAQLISSAAPPPLDHLHRLDESAVKIQRWMRNVFARRTGKRKSSQSNITNLHASHHTGLPAPRSVDVSAASSRSHSPLDFHSSPRDSAAPLPLDDSSPPAPPVPDSIRFRSSIDLKRTPIMINPRFLRAAKASLDHQEISAADKDKSRDKSSSGNALNIPGQIQPPHSQSQSQSSSVSLSPSRSSQSLPLARSASRSALPPPEPVHTRAVAISQFLFNLTSKIVERQRKEKEKEKNETATAAAASISLLSPAPAIAASPSSSRPLNAISAAARFRLKLLQLDESVDLMEDRLLRAEREKKLAEEQKRMKAEKRKIKREKEKEKEREQREKDARLAAGISERPRSARVEAGERPKSAQTKEARPLQRGNRGSIMQKTSKSIERSHGGHHAQSSDSDSEGVAQVRNGPRITVELAEAPANGRTDGAQLMKSASAARLNNTRAKSHDAPIANHRSPDAENSPSQSLKVSQGGLRRSVSHSGITAEQSSQQSQTKRETIRRRKQRKSKSTLGSGDQSISESASDSDSDSGSSSSVLLSHLSESEADALPHPISLSPSGSTSDANLDRSKRIRKQKEQQMKRDDEEATERAHGQREAKTTRDKPLSPSPAFSDGLNASPVNSRHLLDSSAGLSSSAPRSVDRSAGAAADYSRSLSDSESESVDSEGETASNSQSAAGKTEKTKRSHGVKAKRLEYGQVNSRVSATGLTAASSQSASKSSSVYSSSGASAALDSLSRLPVSSAVDSVVWSPEDPAAELEDDSLDLDEFEYFEDPDGMKDALGNPIIRRRRIAREGETERHSELGVSGSRAVSFSPSRSPMRSHSPPRSLPHPHPGSAIPPIGGEVGGLLVSSYSSVVRSSGAGGDFSDPELEHSAPAFVHSSSPLTVNRVGVSLAGYDSPSLKPSRSFGHLDMYTIKQRLALEKAAAHSARIAAIAVEKAQKALAAAWARQQNIERFRARRLAAAQADEERRQQVDSGGHMHLLKHAAAGGGGIGLDMGFTAQRSIHRGRRLVVHPSSDPAHSPLLSPAAGASAAAAPPPIPISSPSRHRTFLPPLSVRSISQSASPPSLPTAASDSLSPAALHSPRSPVYRSPAALSPSLRLFAPVSPSSGPGSVGSPGSLTDFLLTGRMGRIIRGSVAAQRPLNPIQPDQTLSDRSHHKHSSISSTIRF